MPLPTNVSTTCKAGPLKINSGIILKVTGANAPVANLSEITNASVQKNYGSLLTFPVSALSSGNMGLVKAISGRNAGIRTKYVEAKGFIAMKLPTKVAGTQTNILQGASPDTGIRMSLYKFYSYQRLNITSWNAVTGAATYGAARGNSVLASGINGVVGKAADLGDGTAAVPAQFVYITGPVNPSTVTSPKRTNP